MTTLNHTQAQAQIHPQIQAQITQVCADKAIRCLHAIESGSRAWGFASPDSDYDVRLIYCHQPDWYLRLISGRDNFEFINNELFAVPFDIGGWDIRKALKLLYKSNAVILEWLRSSIILMILFCRRLMRLKRSFLTPKPSITTTAVWQRRRTPS